MIDKNCEKVKHFFCSLISPALALRPGGAVKTVGFKTYRNLKCNTGTNSVADVLYDVAADVDFPITKVN